jgi:hypothetical protein
LSHKKTRVGGLFGGYQFNIQQEMFLFQFCLIFLIYLPVSHAACSSASFVDTTALPSAPIFPTATLSSSLTPTGVTPIENHWSEVAQLAKYRPEKISPIANPPQLNCPHLQSGLRNWHDPSLWGGTVPTGGAVSIPLNTRVLIASCSIDTSTIFGIITIPSTSELIFADAVINIQTTGIVVQGALRMGSTTCRLRNKISITLHGSRGAQTLPAAEYVKGIYVTGQIDVHGAQYFPTWTRLALTAAAGDTRLFIQDLVNWQVGQTIVITSTELKDSRDWHANEECIIVSVFRTTLGADISAVYVAAPLRYTHYGGPEYQAEVALLSRNILIQGDSLNSDPTDTSTLGVCTDSRGSTYPCNDQYLTGFGAHVMVAGPGAQGKPLKNY